VYELREHKSQVEEWVESQPEVPDRREAQKLFPGAPVRLIRAAIQSRKDREAKSPPKGNLLVESS